ncbi:hypothetical protein ES705_10548 [subsurface metagenome]
MLTSDRDIKNWEERLKDQVQRGWDNYFHHRIDLSIARTDEIVMLAGEFLIVEESSSASATASVKLNMDKNDALRLRKGVGIETVFVKLYLTNTAQPGEWLNLIVGINFKYTMRKSQLGINEIQVQWAGADSVSIPAIDEAFSDAFVFSTDASSGHIQLKAHNEGVPAAGDTIDFFLNNSAGRAITVSACILEKTVS